MALPAQAPLLRASTYPNVANEGARAFEMKNRVTDTGTHTAAMDAELKLVEDEAGELVFPNGATETEAACLAIFEERPQFMEQYHTIVNNYALDS